MRIAVVSFPGSNCDDDCVRVFGEVLGARAYKVRHDEPGLGSPDAVILPGGFSFGDALRCGAIARFSPAMDAVRAFAASGGPVLGICNGFQILTEAGLLPGALRRNLGLSFLCCDVHLRVEGRETPVTRGLSGTVLRVPIAHNEGNYFAPPDVLERLEGEGQVIFRYVDADGRRGGSANPNGAMNDIAGLCNDAGNVVGLMPHPERCAEALLGNTDGRRLLESLLSAEGGGR